MVLSTCQRTEIYSVAHRYHPAVADIRNFLSAWSGLPPESFVDGVYDYYDDMAVSHLFKVAAGFDSAVLGEGEILGQLRDAWLSAQAEGSVGPFLSILFRQAIEVGKRVRSETAIARGTTSLSQTAVALAAEQLGSLAGRTTLVIGAGEMGEAMAQALPRRPRGRAASGGQPHLGAGGRARGALRRPGDRVGRTRRRTGASRRGTGIDRVTADPLDGPGPGAGARRATGSSPPHRRHRQFPATLTRRSDRSLV